MSRGWRSHFPKWRGQMGLVPKSAFNSEPPLRYLNITQAQSPSIEISERRGVTGTAWRGVRDDLYQPSVRPRHGEAWSPGVSQTSLGILSNFSRRGWDGIWQLLNHLILSWKCDKIPPSTPLSPNLSSIIKISPTFIQPNTTHITNCKCKHFL